MEFDWFWFTVIVLIIAICVNSIFKSYFACKYGKNEDDEKE